jgi:putative SOS response-associated peptidase YedK
VVYFIQGGNAMCTRYYLDSENPDLYSYVETAGCSSIAKTFLAIGDPLKGDGEIRPSDVAPVIATAKSRRKEIFPMQWGYTMTGASGDKVSLLLNARSETAAEKKTFAEGWKIHRCIIPASWYFEWEHFQAPNGRKKTGSKYMIPFFLMPSRI